MARTCFSAGDSASPTFTPPVAQWKNTCTPISRAAAHTGSSSGDQYGIGDTSISIPFANAAADARLYPGDYLLAQRPYYYTYLWDALGWIHAHDASTASRLENSVASPRMASSSSRS